MLTFAIADVHAIEHNLRVVAANRSGETRTSMMDPPNAGNLRTDFGWLISLVFHGNPGPADNAVSVERPSAQATSRIQSVA